MSLKKLSLNRQVLVGFGLAAAVLVGLCLVSWQTTGRFMRTSGEAVYHAQVVAALERALSRMYEVEAAQRGFMVSEAPAFLVQRNASLAEARSAIGELRLRGDEALRAKADGLLRLIDARARVLDEVMAAHDRQPDEARALLLRGTGTAEMQELARSIAAVAGEQRALLESRAQAARDGAAWVYGAFSLAALGVLVMFAAILRVILSGIAERQRAYAALAESQARLNAVVDTALDAIVVIDERGIVERFNRSAEKMFGYRADEVVGRNVSMLMPSPEREAHDAHLARYRRTGERRIIGRGREVTAQRKDGSRFPVDLAVGETLVDGHRLFTGLIRDISTRKAAEALQAELMHDLKTANEELTNFAYVASHDLKAPLRGIGSLAHWLSTDYADKFDDEGRAHMALLLSRVKRMDRLIDGILQYSRVGRVKEARTQVDLGALVSETLDLLAPPPSVQIRVGALPTVGIDRTRAQQVFQNLLSNAIRYMDKPEGRIEVDCAEEADAWHFRVEDNGPGIDRKHWDRVFQLFQSLSKRDDTESTGIGLSLVKKIVEMHGGRIWLDSEVGRGSAFHFTLPRELSCT